MFNKNREKLSYKTILLPQKDSSSQEKPRSSTETSFEKRRNSTIFTKGRNEMTCLDSSINMPSRRDSIPVIN